MSLTKLQNWGRRVLEESRRPEIRQQARAVATCLGVAAGVFFLLEPSGAFAQAGDPTQAFRDRASNLTTNLIAIGGAVIGVIALILVVLKFSTGWGSWWLIGGNVAAAIILGTWATVRTMLGV